MKHIRGLLFGFSCVATFGSAQAGQIPYPNPGTENPATYTFKAAATADVSAYFYGNIATFDEQLGLLVNGVDTGVIGLDNQGANYGDKLDFGTVDKGATLTFFIYVADTNEFVYSDPSLDPGGRSPVYATSFGGDGTIPQGTYIGFEDQLAGDPYTPDFKYQNEEFVATNTLIGGVSAVPLPASAPMFGAALAALGAAGLALRRRPTAA